MINQARNAFDSACSLIRKDYSEMGADGKELGDRLIGSFVSTYSKPPTEEFEQILQRNFTDDEVRVALFKPRDEQIKFYPILLLCADQEEIKKLDELHPLSKLKALVLSTIFLFHRHTWKGFCEEFIVRGGLDTLANMLSEPNLYYRGQIVEIFLSMTDSDNFDWFEPKSDVLGRTLHIRFLELSDHKLFLDNLLSNRRQSFPGGSMRCLQILAFWLSWVRAMYTKDQKLHLSQKMLSELQLWGSTNDDDVTRIGADGIFDASTKSSQSQTSSVQVDSSANKEEESKLARTLYEDFSYKQYEKVPNSDDGKTVNSPSIESAIAETNTSLFKVADGDRLCISGFDRPASDNLVQKAVVAAFEKIGDNIYFQSTDKCNNITKNGNTFSVGNQKKILEEGAGDLREVGNKLFGAGDYLAALSSYEKGLVVLEEQTKVQGWSEKELETSLHFNCAACHWKIYVTRADCTEAIKSVNMEVEEEEEEEEDEYMQLALAKAPGDAQSDLRACAICCENALKVDPGHFKAGYRLAASKLALGQPVEALQVVQCTTEVLRVTARTTSEGSGRMRSINSTYEMLGELRTRSLAAKLYQERKTEPSKNTTKQESALSGQASRMLAALQKRAKREDSRLTHAFGEGWDHPEDKEDSSSSSSSSNANGKERTKGRMGGDEDVSAYFGSSNVYTGKSDNAGKKVKGGDRKGSKVPSVPSAEEQEKDEKKAKRLAEKKCVRARLTEGVKGIKKALAVFEKACRGGEAIHVALSLVREALACVWTATIHTNATFKAVKEMPCTLNAAFSETSVVLEEGIVELLLMAVDAGLEGQHSDADEVRLLSELGDCDRFGSILGMAVFGNETLIGYCRRICEKHSTDDSKLRKVIGLISNALL